MLGQSEIAINGVLFWLVAGAAIVGLNLLSSLRARRVFFFVINTLFLVLLLRAGFAFVFAGIALLYMALRAMTKKRLGLLSLVSASAAVALLFFVNKIQGYLPGFEPVGTLLSLVGYSFITLRAVEVLRAVYSHREPAPNYIELFNYLVPFHMLAAGPIQAYEDYAREPFYPRSNLSNEDVVRGIELIATGLFNKFVLAFAIQKTFLTGFQTGGPYFVLETLIFTFWSYLDFSSYSQIALGIGKLSGVSTPVNFRNPLVSRNVIEFWDRWHISLSNFVKRNVFLPIQITLMRRSALSRPLLIASFATAVAFVLVGAWHGFTPGWIIWGSLHAFGIIGVRLYTYLLQRHLTTVQLATYRSSMTVRVLATCLTYTYVAFAFVPVALLTDVKQG